MTFAEIVKMREEIDSKKAELNTKLQAEGKDLITKELASVFENVPQLIDIHWRQYTPFFNDGDPCVFSLHEIYFLVEGVKRKDFPDITRNSDPDDSESLGGDYDDGRYSSSDFVADSFYAREYGFNHTMTPEQVEILQNIDKTLNDNDEILKTVFGDHCQVTVRADGIEVEEYDHD